MKEHEVDKELREGVNKRTMSKEDIDRHTLNHKMHKDLKHLNIDEDY
jgi:hypothetical protein